MCIEVECGTGVVNNVKLTIMEIQVGMIQTSLR